MERNEGRKEQSGVEDIGAARTKEGEVAKTMTNLQSNPKGKRSIAIPSGKIKGYRNCSFGLAKFLPSLPERDLFT
jgi:hypothetical protein